MKIRGGIIMKKKTVGIMLSLSMAMSLMACGSSTQPAAASVDTEEPAATTQAASTAEATASSTEAAAVPQLPPQMSQQSRTELSW